ncbi:MAG: RnfABCDGE type electron transport complex subunit G [Bacteroidota bacterium]|nr:RnfABCDGE type electron transport complex subunit G [Bacteroidota bacterium]
MANKKESTFLSMTLTLLIVTVVAAFSLGGVYNLTFEKIEESKRIKKENAIKKVVPEFTELKSFKVKPTDANDSLEFNQAFNEDKLVGTAVATYTDIGFSGRFKIMVGFSPDGKIINTAVLEHKETPGLGDKMDASKSDFPNQFMDKDPSKYNLKVTKDGGDVDAITAATISSRAFCDAVNRAYITFENEKGDKE